MKSGLSKGKKAQISSQVFIFILAGIIMGLVLIMGSKAIISMHNKGNAVISVEFKRNLESKITDVDWGEMKTIDISLPDNAYEVCFCGLNGNGYSCTPDSSRIGQEIADQKKTNENKTVFIVTNDRTLSPLVIPKVYTDGMFCVGNQTRNVRVKVKGINGGNILIEKP